MKEKSTLTWITKQTNKYRFFVMMLAVFEIVVSGLGICYALVMKQMVDRAVAKDSHGFVMGMIGFGLLVLSQLTIRIITRQLSEYTRSSMENTLKQRLFYSLLTKDYGSVSSKHSEEWMNRLTSDTVICADGMTDILPGFLGMLIRLVGSLALILYLQPGLAAIMIPGGILFLIITVVLRRPLKRFHKDVQEKDGKVRMYLQERISRIRRGLQGKEMKGKHIALIGSSSPEWIESYLAVITGGSVAVPLDAGLPAEDLEELLNRSDSEALFISEKNRSLIPGILSSCPKLKQIWMLQGQGEEPADRVFPLAQLLKEGEQAEDPKEQVRAEDIATIIYTYGTTGKSKGVMLTQANLAQNVLPVTISVKPGTKMLSVLPIHHAFCLVMDWLKGFSLGATLCINDSFMHMVRNMGIFQPEIMLMVPMMIETLYKKLSMADASLPKKAVAGAMFGPALHTIFTGGAHLDPFYIGKFEEYGVQVLEGYGMSECSPVISTNSVEDHKAGSIGRPLSNVEVSFENGEILVRGSSVMKGYYKMPQETKEALRGGWLSAHIYPEQAVVEAMSPDEQMIHKKLQDVLDEYNKKQQTYRQITGI